MFFGYEPREVAKAITSAVVALCTYLVGVLPAEGSLTDVSTVQWLGAVVSVAAGFGFTYRVRNRPRL